jgi:hypothetical protein
MHSRKAVGKQRANSFDAVQKGIHEFPAFKAMPHRFDHFVPELVAALGMNTNVPDDTTIVWSRGDKNQNAIPQPHPVHLKFFEATSRFCKQVLTLC